MELQSKCTLVFGATGGIGQVLLSKLRSQNHEVVAISKNTEKLDHLKNLDPSLKIFECDVTDTLQVQTLFKKLEESHIFFDHVVHCIGSITLKPVHVIKDEEWEQSIRLNLSSVFYVLRGATLSWLKRKVPGRFVACSTAAASIGLANHEAIVAAKRGLEGLLISAAASYASKGILVNGVAPGLIHTPLSAKIVNSEVSLAASVAMHPVGKIGTPVHVASAIAWLLDEDQSFVTGQIIKIDGGLSGLKTR